MQGQWARVWGSWLVVLSMGGSLWAADSTTPDVPQHAALTLRDCYALARKRSETIAIEQELLKQTEGRFLQALSGIMPRASFSSFDKRQDGSGGSAFTLKSVPERKFVFSQPLFSGFKEFAAMAGSRAERRQRTYDVQRARQLLFTDVADAFHLLLEQRQDLAALEATRSALSQRIDELKDRQQLGRSRPSEVVSAEAQLRRVEADIEEVRGQEVATRHLLEFLTGLDQIDAVADEDVPAPALDAEAAYMAKASARPDVRAAEEAWRVARKSLLVAQAKFWPTVDAEGNYYTDRVGAAADVDWDVVLKVEVPLFQGGETVGAVKEAASKARQAKLEFERTQRLALLDIRDVYAKLHTACDRLAALQKALAASEENYRLQLEDYRLSLVNNLDVLKTLQEFEDARRDVIHATHESQRVYWQLRVATGEPIP